MASKKKRKRFKIRARRRTPPPRSSVLTLAYEVQSFFAACDRLILLKEARLQGQVDQCQQKLALEGVLLHARNLRDFFVGTGKDRDILAIDFLPRKPRYALPYLRRTRNRMNTLLAHPSYSRSRVSRSWDCGTLRREIEGAWEVFLDRLKVHDKKRFNWFNEAGVAG